MALPGAAALRYREPVGTNRQIRALEESVLAQGTILAPLDGSPLSERSLPYAAALARVLDAKLTLMIASYISDIPEHGPWSEEMVTHPREVSMSYLDSVAGRLGLTAADKVVKVGYPHEMILETARETNASLTVISTHGRSGLGRWLYGSTAGHIIHSSKTPLFVIGKNVPDEASFAPKRLLVPLDGSALGEAALPYASELARAFDAAITLVRVAPFSAEAFPLAVPQAYWPRLDEDLLSSASAYLEKVRENLDPTPDVHVMQGPRADALLDYAQSAVAGLVVMTTHGRAGLQRALLGSTADRMLEGAAPVLLIRPD
jgi:nucleotide-binding universal stress UspA family protein